ncbi:MAG: N-acetylneuraminate synthase family protein [Bradymonadia bacterium]
MLLFGRDLSREVAVVAEIGVNHEGDAEAAAHMIRLAAEAGAHAVKLQTYTPERFVSAEDPARLDRVRRFSLSKEETLTLAQVAREAGVHFFSTAVTEDVVPLIAEVADVIKIASGDLDFEPVITAAARSGKTVIISTGLGTEAEVDQAVRWVDAVGARERLVLMHCVSAYPTPMEDANVSVIPRMAARYGVPVGWSNHVIGPEACHAAVALGAQVVEVHFTSTRENRTFHDHALSMNPEELAALVKSVDRLKAAIGDGVKAPQPSELPLREIIRKGVMVARDLPEGHVITAADLMYARPATAYSASAFEILVGCTVAQAVTAGHRLTADHLSDPPAFNAPVADPAAPDTSTRSH